MYRNYWYGYSYETELAYDIWRGDVALSALFVLLSIYMVWRLARGMWLDRFQKQMRTLQQIPGARLSQTSKVASPQGPRSGLLQISLLPLMLLSSGLAMLIAQARQPDELSRPVTWGMFVVAGSWYSIHAWRRHRGVGPLRNCALAGAASAMIISAILWGFYLTVDFVRADEHAAWHRITGTTATLFWWTAMGGVIGAVLGAWRANRFYHRQIEVNDERAALDSDGRWQDTSSSAPIEIEPDAVPVVRAAPRRRRVAWGTLAVAGFASLLFHVSAAPHIYEVINVRRWVWYDYYHRNTHWNNSLQLTMASVDASSERDLIELVDLDLGFEQYDGDMVMTNVTTLPQAFTASAAPPAPSGGASTALAKTPATSGAFVNRKALAPLVPIRRGQALALGTANYPGNVGWVESSASNAIADPSQLRQAVASRDLPINEPITMDDIVKQPLVTSLPTLTATSGIELPVQSEVGVESASPVVGISFPSNQVEVPRQTVVQVAVEPPVDRLSAPADVNPFADPDVSDPPDPTAPAKDPNARFVQQQEQTRPLGSRVNRPQAPIKIKAIDGRYEFSGPIYTDTSASPLPVDVPSGGGAVANGDGDLAETTESGVEVRKRPNDVIYNTPRGLGRVAGGLNPGDSGDLQSGDVPVQQSAGAAPAPSETSQQQAIPQQGRLRIPQLPPPSSTRTRQRVVESPEPPIVPQSESLPTVDVDEPQRGPALNGSAVPELDGVVVQVGGVAGLATLNLGTDDGLRKDMVLEVYRGTAWVGRIKVKATSSGTAVGEFTGNQNYKIQPGDMVTRLAFGRVESIEQ